MVDLKRLLESRGIKPSYQRIRILEHLMEHRTHPSASALHKALVKKIPTISATTVYNTLSAFAMRGLVRPLTITMEETRFDINTTPHAHFYCRECDQVLDVELDLPVSEGGCLLGNKVEEAHIYLKGVCKNCLDKRSGSAEGVRLAPGSQPTVSGKGGEEDG